MTLTAGIDNGTQSTKVLVYEAESKKILGLAQAPHKLVSKSNGAREQEPSWWIDAARKCFFELGQDLTSKIQAVGVSGQQHGFVALDKEGKPLCPAKLWCDTSTAIQCDEINSALGGSQEVIRLTGNEIKTGYTASKILFLKEKSPDLYAKLSHILLPHDYINFILTGNYTTEYGEASGTGYFDVKRRVWSDEVLKAIDPQRDLKSLLPRLLRAWEPCGRVTKEAAKLFGIPEGILVSCGGGDNMMGAIGTGTVENGAMTMSLGTSGTLYGASDAPVIDMKGRLASFCSSSDSWLPLLCTMNCTVSSEVTRRILGKSVLEFGTLASKAPIGASGVVMIPYFNGERTPNYPNGKGCILGLSLENMSAENISRAAMESSIYGLKYGLDAFFELGFKAKYITLTGGGSKSPLWRQMVADVCNLQVRLPENPQAAAFGAALQALSLLEGQKSIVPVVKKHVTIDPGKTCLPKEENLCAYKKSYSLWLDCVKAMGPLFQ